MAIRRNLRRTRTSVLPINDGSEYSRQQVALRPDDVRNRKMVPDTIQTVSSSKFSTQEYGVKPKNYQPKKPSPSMTPTSSVDKVNQYAIAPDDVRKRQYPETTQVPITEPVAVRPEDLKKRYTQVTQAIKKAEATPQEQPKEKIPSVATFINEYYDFRDKYIPGLLQKTKTELVSEIKTQVPILINDVVKTQQANIQSQVSQVTEDIKQKMKMGLMIAGGVAAITLIINIVMLIMMLKKKAS